MSVLYITFTGILDPLGESQVLQYLLGLSKHNQIYLVSLEKKSNLLDSTKVNKSVALCNSHKIKWLKSQYNHNPNALGFCSNVAAVLFQASKIVIAKKIHVIHARSYLACLC